MSNKLVRKKKNKPKYGWMQDEIDALARKDARDRQLAGYGVTMANHALEIGFWVLHDKFGFGKKRLNRMMDCINAYLVAEYNEELNIRQLPLKAQMIARVEYDTIQNCMKAVEEQPTAYDVENMISEVEVKMKAMWYFLDCHSAQCDNESGGDCSYCKKDFYDEIDKIVEQLKNELSNH